MEISSLVIKKEVHQFISMSLMDFFIYLYLGKYSLLQFVDYLYTTIFIRSLFDMSKESLTFAKTTITIMLTNELVDRYVNFYTDFAFKRLFKTETNKDLLITFLNALLDGEEKIKDLYYLSVDELGIIDHSYMLEVCCENEKGERFIIEMQKAEQQFFKDRSVFYSTFPIRDQAKRGKLWNFQLKAVYTIGILDFCFDDTDPEYFHHEVKLMDTKTKEVFFDKLTYIYLEMPKFTKTLSELETLFDKWLYAIRHLPDLMERPKELYEAVFERFFEQAEIAKFNRQELQNYEYSLKNFWDWYSIMQTAENKSRAEGLAKGRAEGAEEKNKENARKMRLKGYPVNEISDITGLSIEEIERLQP